MYLNPQATSGLTGLQEAPGATSLHAAGFLGYDDLVKAKGMLDLIVDLPSFDEDLGETTPCVRVVARENASCEMADRCTWQSEEAYTKA